MQLLLWLLGLILLIFLVIEAVLLACSIQVKRTNPSGALHIGDLASQGSCIKVKTIFGIRRFQITDIRQIAYFDNSFGLAGSYELIIAVQFRNSLRVQLDGSSPESRALVSQWLMHLDHPAPNYKQITDEGEPGSIIFSHHSK